MEINKLEASKNSDHVVTLSKVWFMSKNLSRISKHISMSQLTFCLVLMFRINRRQGFAGDKKMSDL